LKVLLDFMRSLDLARMRPDGRLLQLRGGKPRGPAPFVLASPGRQYAVYFPRGTRSPADCMLDLPAGEWRVEGFTPADGRTEAGATLRHAGGALHLRTPRFSSDLALRLTKIP
jgi:hypothetical protein